MTRIGSTVPGIWPSVINPASGRNARIPEVSHSGVVSPLRGGIIIPPAMPEVADSLGTKFCSLVTVDSLFHVLASHSALHFSINSPRVASPVEENRCKWGRGLCPPNSGVL